MMPVGPIRVMVQQMAVLLERARGWKVDPVGGAECVEMLDGFGTVGELEPSAASSPVRNVQLSFSPSPSMTSAESKCFANTV